MQQGLTPLFIKRLIQVTIFFSLFCVAIDPLTLRYWHFSLQSLFALTSDGYPWQFLTSLFLIASPIFSFGYLIDIAFSMLILWLLGSLLYERIGLKKFAIGYALSGILGGIVAFSIMDLGYYSEALFALLAVVTMWTMSDPYQQLYFLFVLPLKARWILIFALLGTIVTNGLQQDYASSLAYLTSFIFSYFYSLIILDLQSPFHWMRPFDRFLKKLDMFWQWRIMGFVRNAKKRRSAFVDRTLEKISKHGKDSLNPYERLRLWWISRTSDQH